MAAELFSREDMEYLPPTKVMIVNPELRKGSVFTAEIFKVNNPCYYCNQISPIKGDNEFNDSSDARYQRNKCYVSAKNYVRCINCLDKRRKCLIPIENVSGTPISLEQRRELGVPEIATDLNHERPVSTSGSSKSPGKASSQTQPVSIINGSLPFTPAPASPTNTSAVTRSAVGTSVTLHPSATPRTAAMDVDVDKTQSLRTVVGGLSSSSAFHRSPRQAQARMPASDTAHLHNSSKASNSALIVSVPVSKKKRSHVPVTSDEDDISTRADPAKKIRTSHATNVPTDRIYSGNKSIQDTKETVRMDETLLEPGDTSLNAAAQLDRDNAQLIAHIGTLFDQLREQQRLAEFLRTGKAPLFRSQAPSTS